MVKIVKRNVADLEDNYRKLLGRILWIMLIVVTLFQILAGYPFYIFGYTYYYLPFVAGSVPLLIAYYVMTMGIEGEMDNAKPKVYIGSVLSLGLILGFTVNYCVENIALTFIKEVENKAQKNLAELATAIHQFSTINQKRSRDERLRLNGDWNQVELYELPKKFKGKLSLVGLNADIKNIKEPLDGYHFFYRCSSVGVWHVWCHPANNPEGGRLSWLMNKKGKLLARDFRGEMFSVKQFPVNKRTVKNYTDYGVIRLKDYASEEDEDSNS